MKSTANVELVMKPCRLTGRAGAIVNYIDDRRFKWNDKRLKIDGKLAPEG